MGFGHINRSMLPHCAIIKKNLKYVIKKVLTKAK